MTDEQARTTGAGLSPVASLSRRDAAMREIRRAVVTGALQPGDKLTENQLTTRLNVSRPTMREALTQLAQEGLLIQEPYRGLRVADVDPKAIMDIARARVALDMLAAEEILADSTGGRLDRVRQAWADYDRLPIDADDLVAHEAHIAFHRSIWEASENTLLIRLWSVTEAHITIALARDQLTRHDPRRAHDIHRRVVDALVGGDLGEIRDAMVAHTIDSAEELVGLLTAPDLSPAG
ncbi:MAG: GntR family transcriptional regulator [Actinomycetales bacterium]